MAEEKSKTYVISGEKYPEAKLELTAPMNEMLDQWFSDTFHNRALDTSFYNAVYESFNNLKQKLARLMAGKV